MPYRMSEVPTSGPQPVPRLASGAVASGGFFLLLRGHPRSALFPYTTLSPALYLTNRRPVLPVSGREHVLRLAGGAVASGGYCRHRAGDGELALHVSQRLPTAIGMPYR